MYAGDALMHYFCRNVILKRENAFGLFSLVYVNNEACNTNKDI